MKAAGDALWNERVFAPDGRPVGRRRIILWEAGAFVFVMLGASALHFAYELSGFQLWVTAFGSVNESTFEHLKLFFWPALLLAAVQHAYTRERVNNFWLAKATAMLVAPIVLIVSFYFYLGIALPIYGRGALWADIGTGALGVLAGNLVSYRIMTAHTRGRAVAVASLVAIALMAVMYVVFTHAPPRVFLFEDFMRYTYSGNFGILPDYSDYLVFKKVEP